MKKKITLILFAFCVLTMVHAQQWKQLPGSPNAPFRHDDIFFVNPDTGWLVNVNGNIYRTINSGATWQAQVLNSPTAFRSVGFANGQKGWAGNLGPDSWAPTTDTFPLYQTTNSGLNWQPVTNITGTRPTGICGISVVNASVVYAVGRVHGPAFVLKTMDGGASWHSSDLSGLVAGLIDCYFFSPDTGIVVGYTGDPGTGFGDAFAVILRTTDGGQSWQIQHESLRNPTTCWKITFPTDSVGYVSVESYDLDSVFVLKTTDQGVTWQEKFIDDDAPWFQGIGFVDKNTGWIGPDGAYSTTDGGATWQPATFLANFNRFRKVNDTLAFAAGKRVWRWTRTTVSTADPVPVKNPGFALGQNYPNPFSGKTTIPFYVPRLSRVKINVYDIAGRFIRTLIDKDVSEGNHEVAFQIAPFKNSLFLCVLEAGDVQIMRHLLLLKER